jgi:hypothetical protein
MLFLRWYFWIAPHAVLGVCAAILWHRQLYKQYLVFASYVAFQLIEFLITLAANLLMLPGLVSLEAYRWLALGGMAVVHALAIGVFYEIGDDLVFRRSFRAKNLRSFARWTVASVILIAVACSALFPQTNGGRVISAFQALNYSASLASIGLIVALLALTRALCVSWSSLPAGVALGFAVNACVELCAAALLSMLGMISLVDIDFISMGSFHISAVIWLVYLLFPGKPPTFTGRLPDRADLEAWDQELQKMMR